MGHVAILLLAAGASSRMRGPDKMLEPVGGVPVLRRQAKAALAVGGPVLVTLPPGRPLRRAVLDGLDVILVEAPDAGTGMAASIRAGVAALPSAATGVAILPADMPEITGDDLRLICQVFIGTGETRVVRGASETGKPGHPVIFPARLFPALSTLSGDAGARPALEGQDIRLVPLPAQHALTDLDTLGDWAAWCAGQTL